MKIFPLKIFAPRKYRHRSNMKRPCPLCGSFLELDKRGFHCPEGCDIAHISSEHFGEDSEEKEDEASDREERKKHRAEYRENPEEYMDSAKGEMKKSKKAFFIDRKV